MGKGRAPARSRKLIVKASSNSTTRSCNLEFCRASEALASSTGVALEGWG